MIYVRSMSAALLAAVLPAAQLWAVDTVKTTSGNQVSGKVTIVTQSEVTIEATGGKKQTFPTKDVDSIRYDDEPKELTAARNLIKQGKHEQAHEQLEKLDASSIDRSEIKQDIAFYKAVNATRLAEMGNGSKMSAGKQLLAFERASDQSYHYFDACQTLGDLLVGMGKASQAAGFYARLKKAPWPEYKLRAEVLGGRALQKENKHDAAMAKFDEVLAAKEQGKGPDRERAAAMLGKAASLAASGKNPEAIQLVNQVIAKGEAEDVDLHARAYNVLGNCYLATNQKKDALLAFLHVELLYPTASEQHAEALYQLSTLWSQVEKTDRAAKAREELLGKYPKSTWAQKLAR